jgi:hypothetical protein
VGLGCIVGPVGPGGPSSLVVHCPNANCCPHSIEITLDQRPEGGWTFRQGHFCGRGYIASKRERDTREGTYQGARGLLSENG